MDKIEVKVIEQPANIAARASLACNLTQHPIASMADLDIIYEKYKQKPAEKTIKFCQDATHGTPTRHGEYTIAIVGASRRVLTQIRTHGTGFSWTSASLQYQDVRSSAQFVVPYEVFEHCEQYKSKNPLERFFNICGASHYDYTHMISEGYDHDTAGYILAPALRNVILVTANAEAWRNFIYQRACNRNTPETQYVTFLIWYALMSTEDGETMFDSAGPTCMWHKCNQGRMCCGRPLQLGTDQAHDGKDFIRQFVGLKWPLLKHTWGDEDNE